MVQKGGIPASLEYSILIQAGDVIMFTAQADLTGSKVAADKPIAVTSGNQCANVPNGVSACDHLVEMLPPVTSFGYNFFTHPLETRNADLIRIVASEDNTEISINGTAVAQIQKGEYYDKIESNATHITTSNPSLVGQYSLGTSYDGVTSDPFMMLVPPSTQYLNDYTFATLGSSQNFDKAFVNVIIPTTEVDTLQLDGAAVDPTLFSPIANGYSSADIEIINEGSHNLKADVPFGTFVYGFGGYDSYGYPGGMLISSD